MDRPHTNPVERALSPGKQAALPPAVSVTANGSASNQA